MTWTVCNTDWLQYYTTMRSYFHKNYKQTETGEGRTIVYL